MMNEQWLKLKEWWVQLAQREKRAVLFGSGALGIFVFYTLIWSPLLIRIDTMRQQIVSQQKSLLWMTSADVEIKKLEASNQKKSTMISPLLLLSLLQREINQAGLAQQLLQLKQGSNDTVEMHFQKVEFDKLLSLLIKVSKEQSVIITQLTANAETTPGIVDADVVLSVTK